MKWLSGFLKEDNGNYSSMRLIMVWIVGGVVPLFLLACIFAPHIKDLTVAVLTFAGSLVGLKFGQKAVEKPLESNNQNKP